MLAKARQCRASVGDYTAARGVRSTYTPGPVGSGIAPPSSARRLEVKRDRRSHLTIHVLDRLAGRDATRQIG